MSELYGIITEHARRYPESEPRDLLKLVFQSVKGGEHLISDRNAAYGRVISELAAIGEDGISDIPLYEEIGGGHIRLNLRTAEKYFGEDITAMIFAYGKAPRHDTKQELEDAICIARKAVSDGLFGFSGDGFSAMLHSWDHSPVSHSERYRYAYKPHYRVTDRAWVPLFPLLRSIYGKIKSDGRVTVAIDGIAGAGKSTAAQMLLSVFPDASLICADDFFLPKDKRTAERLSEPGGNIDRERMLEEATVPLMKGERFKYRIFDCSRGEINGEREVVPSRINIVEGSYCRHPFFGRYYSLGVYMTLQEDEQKRRIIRRNGDLAEMFFSKWIPLEEKYNVAFGIKDSSEHIIELV